jgi:hypothetical protein
MGGNLAVARYYGRYLALQIKALEEGLASYRCLARYVGIREKLA